MTRLQQESPKNPIVRNLKGGALTQTRTLSGTDANHRYRTFELTIPLRNVLYAPTS